MDNAQSNNKKINKLFVLMIIFNFLFPKAGIKIDDIPITVGNILFLLILIDWKIRFKIKFPRRISRIVLCMIVGFNFWLIVLFIAFISQHITFGSFASYFIPLCVYPIIFFVYPFYIQNDEQENKLIKIIFICIFLVILYEIIQYIFGIGKVAVPGVTVNLTDYLSRPSSWWRAKNNGISETSKMVSTYQNGNLLGIALIMYLPLLFRNSTNTIVRYLFCILSVVGIMLAGSRTIYIGILILVIYVFFKIIFLRKIRKNTLIVFFVAVFALIVFVTLVWNSLSDSFVNRILSMFDSDTLTSATGRSENAMKYFAWLWNSNILAFLFGGISFNHLGGAYEMTYICVLMLGGVVGLFLFLYPIISILFVVSRRNKKDCVLLGGIESCVIFLIVAYIEGGYWLPPTALNFWLILSITYWHGQSKNEETELLYACVW